MDVRFKRIVVEKSLKQVESCKDSELLRHLFQKQADRAQAEIDEHLKGHPPRRQTRRKKRAKSKRRSS